MSVLVTAKDDESIDINKIQGTRSIYMCNAIQ